MSRSTQKAKPEDPGARWNSGESDSIIVVDIATGAASSVAEGKSATWVDRHTLLVDVA